MANDIEKLQFVDKAGLEQFWADVQTYLTRNYKNLPAGMQFSRIYQANGQLHVLVEEFGGDTAARKEASRENLDVYSTGEVDTEVAEAVAAAIDSLDVSAITVGQDMTIGTISEVDGKIVVNPVPIVVGTSNIADSAVTTDKIDDEAVTADKIDDKAVTTAKLDDGAVTYEKVTNTVGHPFPIDISGNAANATHADDASHADVADDVSEGSALDQRLDAIETDISDLDTAKADKVQGQAGEDLAGKVVLSNSVGNLVSSGKTVMDSAPVDAEGHVDYTVFNGNIPSGRAVVDAIEDLVNRKDADVTSNDGRNLNVRVVEENGAITEVHVVGNTSATRLASSVEGDIPAFDANHDLGTTGRHVVNSLYNDETNPTSGETESTDTEFIENIPTGKAVQEAIDDSLGVLDKSNDVADGKYITSLSQNNGQVSYTVGDMDTVPADGSAKPVTSGGVKSYVDTTVYTAVDSLDVADLVQDSSGSMSGKTLKSLSEENGKISATFQDINIVSGQVTDKQTNTFDGSAETLTTGKAVKAAVDTLNGTVQASSTNVSVSVTETAGKLTGITVTDTAATAGHVHGEINNDGTIGETADLAVVTGESGAVTVADLSTAAPVASGTDTAFVTTVSQDSKGKITAAKANLPEATTEHAGIVRLVDSYDSNSTTMAPTANALKEAYEHSSQVIADLDVTNHLGNGQYITDLSQTDGKIEYGVADMAIQPVQGDMKPITSGGVQVAILAEQNARVAFDTKIDSYLPEAVSPSNKLADKAYVDAIGERLEARYLASSASNDLPFPTKAAFDAAQAATPQQFYYEHELTTPDNNDVVVVTADESKIDQSTTGVAPTTRYRFIAHKVQATDENGDPIYDEETHEPVWKLDSNEEPVWVGSWYFEYVINNSALNQDQLLAINSGITPTKRSDYDHHVYNLAPVSDGQGNIHYEHQDHMNPHGTTYTQTMQAESGLDTTATELQSLHGLDTEHVGAAQFNALAGLNLENNQTIQNQLDVKADRVLPKYDTSGYSVSGKIIVGADTADQNGRYNIIDSGIGITENYVPGDVAHVTTGASITKAIQTLDRTVSSPTENKKVSVTIVEDDGLISSVSVDDTNAASAVQGAKADTAIQNVIVHKATGEDQTLVKDANQAVTLDLSGYKPLQGAVSDPTASSDPTLEFISNITQDVNGVISPVKNAVKVSSNYVVDGTDPVNGTAVTAALSTLDAEISSTKDVGVVSDNIALKVTEVNGKVTEVLVTKDNTVNAGDIATAIEALNYANPLQAGDYIKEISETDGKIAVVKEAMDTSPVSESKKPITSGGVYSAIAALDATNQVSAGDYITAVNETDGKVSVVTDTMDTTPSANSQKPVTSGGVKTELDKKADKVTNATANDIAMLDGNGNIADTGRFITNQYLDPDTTKTEEERRQVFMSNVPTGTAVKAIVDEAVSGIHSEIEALDATVSSADGTTPGTNVDVQVVEADGVITGVNIVRDGTINATDLSTAINALDATVSSADTGNTSGQNVDVQVIETNGKITGVNIIRDNTANAHDIEGAIADLNAEVDSTLKSSITKSNIGLRVTETAGEVTEVLITKDDTVNAQDVSSAITTALDALDLSEVGGSTNTYISAISEANGQVSATATQMNTSIMDKSGTALNVAPTTGAVKDAIEALDYTDSAAQYNFVTAVSETDGKINVSKKTLKFDDVYVDPNNDNDLLPINKGGTGARTDGAARTALDVYSKGEVDSMVSGHGKFLGNLTATEINNLTSISNSDTVICVVAEVEPPAQPDNQVDRGDGTYITVRDGEQLIVSDKSGTPLWESVTGKFKLTQHAYSDARTSDDFSVIDGLTQNANGEVTTTRHSLSDASNIGGTATHGLMSATDKVKLDALPDRSDLDNSLAAKADKVSNATAGNFAALDANGNLTDSGHKHSDYKTVQTAVADPSASGSTLVAIDTISQDTNGKITVTKKNIQDGTTEQKGVVQLAGSIGTTVSTENNKAATEKAVRDAINDLDVSNITGFDKGKTLATLTETNGKIAATFQDIDITSAHVTDKQTTTFDGTAETLTTGKAVKSALDTLVNGLDAEVTSTDGTNVQVKVTEANGKITAVNVTTDNTENKGNKVSSWSSTLTDGHYPSEKLVKTELDKKADKLTTATADNFASFDANGNLKDSGRKHSDYKTKQTAVETATVDTGSTLTFISSVTQDTNGVITPMTKTVTVDSTYSADGPNPVNGTAVAAAIGTLDSEKTGTGTNVTVKVKEVDGKIDSVTVTDTSASSTHVHGNITNDGKISLSGTVQTTKSVVTDENGKVAAFDLTTASPNTDGTGTAFITSVSQEATGKISATKAALPTATVPSGSATTGTAGIVSLSNATNSNSQTVAATSKAVSDLATSVGNAKADKVSGTGLSGHLAGLDANGNLTDSGIAASNVKTKQSAKTDPTASGNTLSFIDTITQDSNGEITATKKNVTVDDTYSATGTNPVNGKAVAHAIGTLDVTVTGMAANKTIATLTETDGKIAATFQDIHISMSQVDDFSHAHGNISYEGEIDSSTVTIGSGDSLVFTDSSNSNKVEKSSVTFDGSTTNQFLSKKGTWSDTVAKATNATNDADGNAISSTYVKVSQKGVANGVATLDANGKIPTSQIPGSYDDVKEGYYYNGKFYSDSAHTTEIPAESDKVYVDKDTNKTYRWSGTQYVVIGSDLALGETSSTAYRGDRGKIAYDHSQITSGNPHNVTADDVGITVSEIDGVTHETVVDGVTHTVTYKYTHPTTTAVAASAKKVGYDNQGHVVLGDALVKGDVGLGNVDNTSDATKKTNFTGAVASGNTGFPTGDMVYQAIADGKECVVVTVDTPYSEVAAIVNADKFPVLKYTGMYFPLTLIVGGGDTTAYWFYSTRLGNPDDSHTSITVRKYVCKNANPAWTSPSDTYIQNNIELVSSWSTTVSNSRYPSEKLVKTSLDKKVDKVDGMGLSSNDYTTDEKTKLAGIAAGAEVNQNAFSNVKVGSTTVAADSKTDTLELVAGSNVTITPDATNDKITIAATDTTYESKAAASGGTDVSLVTTGEKYTWNSKQDALAAQTAYTSKGTATKVPQITTNALGQVTGITEVTIAGVTPASHEHGNIQNGGTLQTNDVTIANGDKLVITDYSDSNKVARASAAFDGSTTTKALTQKGTFEDFAKQADIDEAIEDIPTISLVGDNHITVTSDDTTGTVTVATDIATQTAYTAKGSATKVPQITTNALGQVTGITEVEITGVTPASHTHGSITNDGKIGSTADLAVVTGTSGAVTTADLTTAAPSASGTGTAFITSVSQDSKGKISASKANLPTASTSASGIVQLAGSIGATVSSENNKAASEKAVRDAINALDVDSVGGAGKYISAISETNGKIAATVTTMDTTPTANSTNAITSGAVKTALERKTNNLAISGSIPASGTRYIKITNGNGNHLSGILAISLPNSHKNGEWLLHTYGNGDVRSEVSVLGNASMVNCFWYVNDSVFYVRTDNSGTSSLEIYIQFTVLMSTNAVYPTIELADSIPGTAVQLTVSGVQYANNLRYSRNLAVNLANTSTDSPFNGGSAQTNIKVSGTLGVANGGTGLTSVTSGNFLVGNGTSALTEKTPAQVLSAIGGAASSHAHGDITNSGCIQHSNDITPASEDRIIIADRSASNKVQRSSIAFDGTTTTTALTPKGTWEAFAKAADITTAINALDATAVGGTGKYIKSISETNGVISATAVTMDSTPTSGHTDTTVTSGGIYTALSAKQDTITWMTSAEAKQCWADAWTASATA